MDFFEAVKVRKSVREYSDRPVDRAIIEKILDAGRFAATARNEQPWEFVITQDKANLSKISDMAPNGAFAKDASFLILIFSKDTKYYLEDCSASTQNMLTAIEDLGLGGCWIAGDKKPYVDDVKAMFSMPDGFRLVSMIAAGYPKKETKPKEKRQLKEMTHWEKW